MTQVSDFVAIDMGNTLVKIAHFFENKIFKVEKYDFNQLLLSHSTIKKIVTLKGIYSSVRSEEDNEALEKILPNCINVSKVNNIPINNLYKSSTLGWDRLLNAVAIQSLKKTTAALAIDVGTCIKFDFVDNDDYLGGSISPGIQLRYKSLNAYTARLPYIQDCNHTSIIADNTEDALRSGVINGIQGEINYFIERYKEMYPSLSIFITGGDANHFEIASKNNIFVQDNLTFIGLHQIYTYNV